MTGTPGETGGLLARARQRRSIEQLVAQSGHGEGGDLNRSLGFPALAMLSIGAMVGTGIFFVLGGTVADSGPGVILAFTIAGLLSILSALSYAELASAIPVAGSAYSYAFALFGHFAAWMTGAFLTMEYGLSISAVAVGWGAGPKTSPGWGVARKRSWLCDGWFHGHRLRDDHRALRARPVRRRGGRRT